MEAVTADDIKQITSFKSSLIKSFFLWPLSVFAAGCGGGGNYGGDNGSSAPPPTQNNPPVPDAGDDLSVGERQSVTLTGSATDPDGDPISLIWTQTSGTTVEISNTGTGNATFTAPPTDVDIELGFRRAGRRCG